MRHDSTVVFALFRKLSSPVSRMTWRTLRLPLLLILLWFLLLIALYQWTVQREDDYADELARIQTATLFSNIVDTRAWNAGHGGIWARESPACPANPWLPEKERTLQATNGERLVKINPSYMTRQLAESTRHSLAQFRISSLTPMRPGNKADPWETSALLAFHEGIPEAFAFLKDTNGLRYRYMAPLIATESCLPCHKGTTLGSVLGGISVSISAVPLQDAATARKQAARIAFGLIGLVGTIGIGGATLQINRKKELAESASRTKSAFLANMSHDMRTPLSGILGMTELLEQDAVTPRNRCLLSSLKTATASLLAVVDGIMRYSLLEAEGQPLILEPFSLRAEVEACLAVLHPACVSKGLELHLLMEGTPEVHAVPEIHTVSSETSFPDRFLGDGFRLRQALGNLLGNAVKFTEYGSVTLRIEKGTCTREGARSFLVLRFMVIDTGLGIPAEEQHRIFERFEQGTASRARPAALETDRLHGAGVGLGLAIAQNIAHRFDGTLTLSSTPDRGSTFTLTARFELDTTAVPLPDETTEASVLMVGTNPTENSTVQKKDENSANLFNRNAALDDMDGNTALLQRLIELFLAEETQIREMLHAPLEPFQNEQALKDAADRQNDLYRQIHSLKNSAATLHLEKLRHSAAALETLLRPSGYGVPDTAATHRDTQVRSLSTVRRAFDEACTLLRTTT